MGQIAAAAEITPAVIYDHFPSKAKLHIYLMQRQTTELLTFVSSALAEAPDRPEDRIRIGVGAFFRFVEEHRFAWRMLIRDPPSDPEVAAAYLDLENQASEAISAFIEFGAPEALAGYRNPGQAARMFAEILKAGQNGLAAWWYDHPEVPRQEVVDRMVEFGWLGLENIAKAKSEGVGGSPPR